MEEAVIVGLDIELLIALRNCLFRECCVELPHLFQNVSLCKLLTLLETGQIHANLIENSRGILRNIQI